MASCLPNPAPVCQSPPDPVARCTELRHPNTVDLSPLPPHPSPLTWGENSPDEQFALGALEPGWRQSRAVRLACPLFGCPFSGLRYPGRGRRDALPYFEVHGEGALPSVARDACTPRFVADRGLTSSKPPSGIPAAFQRTGALLVPGERSRRLPILPVHRSGRSEEHTSELQSLRHL